MDDADVMWDVIGQQKAWLDASSATDPTPAVPLRVLKVAEEAGEAAAALIGATGQNPRKGRTHSMDDVAGELCDVVISALVALATVIPDPRRALSEHVGKLYLRSRDAGAPALDQVGAGADREAWLASLPKVVASAFVLFTDAEGRALLLRQTYRPEVRWGLPGGGVEENEYPREAARREVLEEVGLDVEIGPLLAVDWRTHDEKPSRVIYVFDGGVLSEDRLADIRLQEGEIGEFGFFDLEAAEPLLAAHTHRRLRELLAVRNGQAAPTDLEEGRPTFLPQ